VELQKTFLDRKNPSCQPNDFGINMVFGFLHQYIFIKLGKGENFYMQLCVVWEGRSQGVGEGCLGHNNIAFD
jgi:hypothetical protein